MLLVRAIIELRDGSRYPGFVTPAFDEGDLGTQQPQVFVGDRRFGFWGGMFGIPVEERRAFYGAIQRAADAVFPLKFIVEPGLATGVTAGQVQGFYKRAQDRIVVEQ
jgi:hypothetical protein